MRVVVQRVSQAQVSVESKIVSSIGKGYLLLIGMTHEDDIDTAKQMARKIANLRVFSDLEGKMNLSLSQVGGEILSISQFTLYGDTNNSNRPSFTKAMNYKEADKLYLDFNEILRKEYGINVKAGVFGEHMEVSLVNDGPVTIIIEK